MKVVSTEALTKLIQLVKSAFISKTDVVETSEITLATVATSGDYDDLSNKPDFNSKADVDLSNITSIGKNIANWSTNVTNCITEIPQDIKLELNNGTVTLKAGSKVYVPNGAGVFDEVVIESDLSTTGVSYSKPCFIMYDHTNKTIHVRDIQQCQSGTSTPSSAISGIYIYYNTSENKTYQYINNAWVVRTVALPLCTVNMQSSVPYIISIDQAFNGFGYIGSTAFALPGVKGLIPNGRNEDGTLKNIEFVTDKVIIRTITWNNFVGQELFIGKYTINGSMQFISTGRIGQYYRQEDEPPLIQYTIWYKPSKNKVYRCDNSDGNLVWIDCFSCYLGQWFTSATSPYPITELTTNFTFRIIDYNDVIIAEGVKDQRNRSTGIKTWTGTKAQYDAIVTKDSNTLYNITDDINVSLTILEALYPVGAIYIGTMEICPLQVLGVGTWVKISEGRVLQGSDSGHNAGSTIEAGLPNITATGQIGTRYDQGEPTISGAFTNLRHGGKGSDEPNTTGWLYDFNASTSNSIYGNSSTVQPPAFVVNIWKRTL